VLCAWTYCNFLKGVASVHSIALANLGVEQSCVAISPLAQSNFARGHDSIKMHEDVCTFKHFSNRVKSQLDGGGSGPIVHLVLRQRLHEGLTSQYLIGLVSCRVTMSNA
jgi:hypothetical protein